MPLYRVNFNDNLPVSADEINGEVEALKEFAVMDNRTFLKWYVVQADNEISAQEIAEKLAYQIWGDILVNSQVPNKRPL